MNDFMHTSLKNKTAKLPQFIAVEGAIGAGKTTLTKRLAETFNYDTLLEKAEEIQCVSTHLALPQAVPLGKAQQPALWEYADGVDPISFLLEL